MRGTVGVGQLTVTVPRGVEVDVHATNRGGDVTLFGSDESGMNVRRHVVDGSSTRRLELDLEVGYGDLEVRRG